MGEGRSSPSLCHAHTQLPDTRGAWPAANDRPRRLDGAHRDTRREPVWHATGLGSTVAGDTR